MTSPAAVVVRRAVLGDAPALGRLHRQVWVEAYAGLVPDSVLSSLDEEVMARQWHERIGDPDSSAVRVVAQDRDGGLVGFATSGPSRDDHPPTAWELYGVYLRAHAYGTGIADELLGAAVGTRPCSLWVFEPNGRARAFYHRHGFRPDGARVVHEETGVPAVRMVRPPGFDPARAPWQVRSR